MLTLKIRVPYKEGNKKDILDKLAKQLDYVDEVAFIGIVNDTITVTVENGNNPDMILDMRLLEMKEE